MAMQVVQEQSPRYHWQMDSISLRESQEVASRIPRPLIFSIDDRLAEQHLTRLDLSAQHISRIEQLPTNIDFNIVLLDRNDITILNFFFFDIPLLFQLSVSHNRLTDIHLLHRLRSLQKLNLSHNQIDSIDCKTDISFFGIDTFPSISGLRSLQNLVMLNISNNNLHSIGVLNFCPALQSLDASGNAIQQIEDLSHSTSLKVKRRGKNI